MREHIIKLKKGFGTYNPNYYDKFLNQVDYNNMDLYHLDKAIEKREIIKVTVLENSGLIPKEAGFEIAEKLGAEFVCATGRKLVFYRRSHNPKVEHIVY